METMEIGKAIRGINEAIAALDAVKHQNEEMYSLNRLYKYRVMLSDIKRELNRVRDDEWYDMFPDIEYRISDQLFANEYIEKKYGHNRLD